MAALVYWGVITMNIFGAKWTIAKICKTFDILAARIA